MVRNFQACIVFDLTKLWSFNIIKMNARERPLLQTWSQMLFFSNGYQLHMCYMIAVAQ